ncbi:hypothetical protein OGATHE_003307 [Ogataea polymorpha]|uniref:Uncharacterized protein n=1 Tax=Ogataea polymorpha TaxID=460523 RepID=A0A9P8P3E4_9ASCO|nr:hypothetical protein OGATHE_003307 [Ogataea polymorpha]
MAAALWPIEASMIVIDAVAPRTAPDLAATSTHIPPIPQRMHNMELKAKLVYGATHFQGKRGIHPYSKLASKNRVNTKLAIRI